MRSILTWLVILPIENTWATHSALRLGDALGRFWAMYSYFSEGYDWLTKIIARIPLNSDAVPNPVLIELLAKVLGGAGFLLAQLNQFDQALALIEQSCGLARGLGDKKLLLYCLRNYGQQLAMMNQNVKAVAILEESLQLAEELTDFAQLAGVLNGLGVAATMQSKYKQAVYYFGRGVELAKAHQMAYLTQICLANLSYASLRNGQYREAHATLKECIILCLASNNRYPIFHSLYGLAGLAGAPDQTFQNLPRVAKLIGASETFGRTFGFLLNNATRDVIEPLLGTAQSQLDPNLWQQALHEGRAMTPDQIIAFALE